jgi:hypothetical protein
MTAAAIRSELVPKAIRLFSDGHPSHFRTFPDFPAKRVRGVSDQSNMNAANPSEETKARFAELARTYEPKLPRKFAQMMPFKAWIEELRAKGASYDIIRELLMDVNVLVSNDTVFRFCRYTIAKKSRRGRKKAADARPAPTENNTSQPAEPSGDSPSIPEDLAEERARAIGPWTPRKRGPHITDSKNL